MRVAILDDFQGVVPALACFSKLSGHEVNTYSGSVDLAELRSVEALVLIRERTTITEQFLAALPNLRLISQTGGAGRHLDLEACTRRGVVVCQGQGSPIAPAELTWALVLAASRQLVTESENLRAGRWQTTLGRALHGRTLGLLGYGKIAALVARYGRAFGMDVIAFGREGSRARAGADGVSFAPTRDELFSSADVLCLHLRLNDETQGSIRRAELALMKPDSLLVNTARAELIASGELELALRAGRPGSAAIDVFETEPVRDNSGLLSLPNVLATPHLGYVERDTYERYFGAAFDNVVAFAQGTPINVVNPAALTAR